MGWSSKNTYDLTNPGWAIVTRWLLIVDCLANFPTKTGHPNPIFDVQPKVFAILGIAKSKVRVA